MIMSEIEKTYYDEAMRYIYNAEETLAKSGKEDGGKYYSDPKYVKSAAGIAYLGVEKAAKWFLKLNNFKTNIRSKDQINAGLSKINKKALNIFGTAYATLHESIYYQDERKVSIVKEAFDSAKEFISFLKPYNNLVIVYKRGGLITTKNKHNITMQTQELKDKIADLKKKAANKSLPASAVAALNKMIAAKEEELSKLSEKEEKPKKVAKVEKPMKVKKEKKTTKPKSKQVKTKTVDEEPDCNTLLKKWEERREAAKKAGKKAKTIPVFRKISSDVVDAVSKAVKSVSQEEIKKDPKGFTKDVKALEKSAKSFLHDFKTILGSEYKATEIDKEFSDLEKTISNLVKKYGEKFAKGGEVGKKKVKIKRRTARAINQDKNIKAKREGKRISENDNTYYEYRENRSDKDLRKKFEKGGEAN